MPTPPADDRHRHCMSVAPPASCARAALSVLRMTEPPKAMSEYSGDRFHARTFDAATEEIVRCVLDAVLQRLAQRTQVAALNRLGPCSPQLVQRHIGA